MEIRKALPKDVTSIAKIYEEAKRFMREAGNPDQWVVGGPDENSAREDVANGLLYVVTDNDKVIATFMYLEGPDKTYEKIYDGAWLDDAPYHVIHRVALSCSAHGRGVGAYIFNYCFNLTPNLKIDTHRDNIPMQKSLTRAGFVRCGIIYLENGDERIAYQKNA